ncbi:MAG: glycosyl hydrolase [Limisphaerales bacterium]
MKSRQTFGGWVSDSAVPRLAAMAAVVCVLGAAPLCGATESAQAKALFKDPPRQYSTGPLWVWNDLLTERQVRETLRDLAGQKVKQVWVHPRPGLMTPYLSKDWFGLWKAALDEAQRLGMNVWIYDENSYPSGFAGGWVPELMPESRGRGLKFLDTGTAPSWSENLVGLYRCQGDNFEDVTAKSKAGEPLPEGRYLAATEVRAPKSPWFGDRWYVNLLSPVVTEKFLEVTMEAYRREIGSEFGRHVPGVFSDEPNVRATGMAGTFAWSEILPREFEKRWGYSLLEHLPSLNYPLGDWRKVRHNYYEVLNEQFVEHWAKPYHDYCASNHLEWTGHYWDHQWPDCADVPDNMSMYAWPQRPGIDCLRNQYSEHTHAQFGNARMVRELSSVANQIGQPRTLCEAYGASGWDFRFQDMKRIGDWLEVLGVNTLNQHLSYITLRGARKCDYPQSFSYHEPWWEGYHVLAQYFARLSAALSQGQQVNEVLVLEPTTTAWMYQAAGAKLDELGKSCFDLVMALEAAQVEYDLGCEDILARHGSADSAGLKVGRRHYRTVVLPPMTENLNAKTVELLAAFEQAGGTVLSCGEPPARIDGSLSPAGAALAGSDHWKRVETADLPKQLVPTGLVITRSKADGGILFHHRRRLDDGELLFLVNTSIQAPSTGVIRSNLKGVEAWDLYTGQTEPQAFAAQGQGIETRFNLPPSGSLLLFLSRQPGLPSQPAPETLAAIHAAQAPEIRRLAPNVLTLDYMDVTAGGETRQGLYFYQANKFAWQKNGLERNPWDSAVQFKDELISKKFPPGSGLEASYHFQLRADPPANLAIVIERADLYTITCNGQAVTPTPKAWWLDKAFGKIPLALAARAGENVVTIKASPFTMYHELEPAYVLGDFALKPADQGFLIVPDQPLKLGTNWNSQGLPFYGGGVAYRERFQVGQKTGRYAVALRGWYGSVAKVSVRGRTLGYIDAPPWECDVTKWIEPGDNDVEVTVIGTLKNTLGPHHGNPPLGAAGPSAFQVAPNSGPPAGDSYSTVPYGLAEPYVLKHTRKAGLAVTRR